MVKTVLVDSTIRDGEAVLRALDSARIQVSAALWYYDTDSRDWRLLVASPIVNNTSSIEGYAAIQTVIRGLEGITIGLDDISIVAPNHPLIRTLRSVIATGPGISGIRFARNTIDNTYIEDAYIYRLQ